MARSPSVTSIKASMFAVVPPGAALPRHRDP